MAITINGSGSLGGVTSLPTTGLQLADSNMPAGSVLQVVQGTYSTNTTITSTSYVDTNLTASITPSSASNKILVISTTPYMIYSENGDAVASVKLVRNSTTVTECVLLPAHFNISGNMNMHRSMLAINYLDSPSSTSSVTYKIQGKVNDGTSNEQFRLFQDSNKEGAMILMEIVA